MTAVCNVQIIGRKRVCGASPAWPVSGVCKCGHEIGGDACLLCRTAEQPGCLTCWESSSRHQCPVEFRPAAAEVTA